MKYDIPKTCENCQYYSQYFEIYIDKRLNPVDCGACRLHDKKNKRIKTSEKSEQILKPSTPACKNWIENRDVYSLTTTLSYDSIVNSIQDLYMIINHYENKYKPKESDITPESENPPKS